MRVYKMLVCQWNDWSPWHKGLQKNIICPILVWDFGQGALTLSVGCYVTIVHTTQIVKCVLVVGMHQNEHGEGMCDDFWV